MNNLFVISGPSGSGKSTLIQRLLRENPELRFSVSHTTRPPRPGEVDGQHYYFISPAEFSRLRKAGAFAEWANVHDHQYGTSRREIEMKSTDDQFLVLDIDVQGALNIKASYPEAVLVFVAPPSLDDLEKRLLQREKELSREFEKRLETARSEIDEFSHYDYLLVNDELEAAYRQLSCLLTAFRLSTPRQAGLIRRLLGEKP